MVVWGGVGTCTCVHVYTWGGVWAGDVGLGAPVVPWNIELPLTTDLVPTHDILLASEGAERERDDVLVTVVFFRQSKHNRILRKIGTL